LRRLPPGSRIATGVLVLTLPRRMDLAPADAADADHADVAVVIQRADLQLKRAFGIDLWRPDLLDEGFEQRAHIAGADGLVQPGVAVQRRGVNHREVQLLLFVGGTQPVEQVEGAVQYPVWPGARPVDLVDDHDRPKSHGEGFLGDEAGLRHRAVHRIHQQQHRIHHRQYPFDLATEIGVSWRIHDVDVVVAPV